LDKSSAGPRNALDFGCGDGHHTEFLLNTGFEVYTTDVSETAVKTTKPRIGDHPRFHAKLIHDETQIADFGVNFDLIVAWEVLHWPENKFIFSPDAEVLFEQLRSVGVLHDNPILAAQHINRTWPEVQDWWKSNPVQDARRNWAESHARTRPLCWLHWLKILWRL
jgi:2-polyprenyl-3-methyl-5-hydroxy-6-metoxy-1,4-benzoquinol methylase